MKKLIIVVLCIVIAAVGLTVFLKTQKQEASIADVLPQDAFLYVQGEDVEKNLRQIAASPLWRAITGIRYDILAEKNILRPEQKQMIDVAKLQASEVLNNPLTKKLFGKEIALAVYPLDKDVDMLFQEMKAPNPQLVVEFLSGIVFVTRIDPDVQLAELLSRSFTQYGASVSQGQVEYEGETIRTITLTNPGVKFSFVRLKDMLVFGIGSKAVRNSVDVYKGKKPPLSKDSQFLEARALSETSPAVLSFVNFKMFTAFLKSQFKNFAGLQGGSASQKAQAQWDENLAKMSGIKTLLFSFRPGTISEFRTGVVLDRSKLSPEYAPLYSCPSSVNKTIRFAPKDVLGYQWNNCLDLKHYWTQMQQEMAKAPGAGSRIAALEQQIGLSITEDILPALGDEFGGYLSDIKLGGFFPIPKILFFVKIQNKQKAESLIESLKGQAMGMLQKDDYKGTSMEYLNLPMGDIQPGYCFLNDYLLIASNRQMLMNSIDAEADSSLSLAANPSFQELDSGLADKSRSVQFVQVKTVMDKVEGLIDWASQWKDSQDRQAQAFKKGSEMPFEEADAKITALENEIEDMRGQIVLLEDEEWNLESKGEDLTAVRTQMEDVKAQIESKEVELEGERERKQELERLLQEQDQSASQKETRQVYLDEVIDPILEGLRSIQSYGMRMTLEGDILRTSVFLKTSQ